MLAAVQYALIAIPSFIVVLSVVVFVHEWGHFQAAKLRKVAIDTFSIGFGKTLLGWRDKHGVQWKIGALPLGGYVKFADDTDAVSSAPKEEYADPVAKADARRRGLFHAQSLLTRAIVVSAGPFTNFVFAIVAFAMVAFVMGRDIARVDAVTPNSPASEAGLQAGDVISKIDGERIDEFSRLQDIVADAAGRPLAVVVQRSGSDINLTLTPREQLVPTNGRQQRRVIIGVTHNSSFAQNRPIGPIDAIGAGFTRTWDTVARTGTYVSRVVLGKESGNQIAGPIGIFTVSGRAASESVSGPADFSLWQRFLSLSLTLLQLAALISVAVGIVNLLPIPILDGGHLLFYAIEGLRGGKPLPPAAQEWAYRAGFAVMASLFLFATWNDITRLMPGAPG